MRKSFFVTTLFIAIFSYSSYTQIDIYPSEAHSLSFNIDYQNRIEDARLLRSSQLLWHFDVGELTNEKMIVNTNYLRNGSELSINGFSLYADKDFGIYNQVEYSYSYKKPSKVNNAVNLLLRTAFYDPTQMHPQNRALLNNQPYKYQLYPLQNTAVIKF